MYGQLDVGPMGCKTNGCRICLFVCLFVSVQLPPHSHDGYGGEGLPRRVNWHLWLVE
jgi:hypothetical protein